MRPSTGCAFASIHQYSEKLAKSLSIEALPEAPEVITRKSKFLDDILLTYLKLRPSDGPLLLSSIFETLDSNIVVRFMADSSTFADDIAIVSAMQKKFELSRIAAKACL